MEDLAEMRSQEYLNRQKFNDLYMAIRERYDFENKWRKYWTSNYREDWTPKQKRRIRKQTNKWRRRLLG